MNNSRDFLKKLNGRTPNLYSKIFKMKGSNSTGSMNLFDLVFWFLLSIIFPISTGQFNFFQVFNIFIYLNVSFFIGYLFLEKFPVFKQEITLISSGLSIIIGGFICGILHIFLPYDFIIYSLFILFIFYVRIKNLGHLNFSNFGIGILAILPLFLMLLVPDEIALATRFCVRAGDYSFYSAIVESIKVNHSFSNAVYHNGIGINYQAITFLPPAQIADFAKIPSQFALWGVYFKILPIISFSVVAISIIKLYKILFNVKLTLNKFYVILFVVCLLLLFLVPLNIPNILKGKFTNLILLGEGYLLPLGSPGFAIAMMFSSLCLVLILSTNTPSVREKIGLIIFLIIILTSKLALFFPFSIMIGVFSICLFYKKQKGWLITLLLSLPVVYIVYKLTLNVADSNVTISPTLRGFYFTSLPSLAEKYHIPGNPIVKTFLMFFISILLWIHFKGIILITYLKIYGKKNPSLLFLVISLLFSFLIASLPSFFLQVNVNDNLGKIAREGSFDMPQFIRASIFFVSLISIIFLVHFIFNRKKYFFLTIGIFIWVLLGAYGVIKFHSKDDGDMNFKWYSEVITDTRNLKNPYLIMLGSTNYSGQVLSGFGIHPWYSTGYTNEGAGYVFTKAADKRNDILSEILNDTVSKNKKRVLIDYLKNQKVNCLVANPYYIEKVNLAVKDSFLIKIPGTKWLYKLN